MVATRSIFAMIVAFFSCNGLAALATRNQSPVVTEFLKLRYEVKKDGSFKTRVTQQYKVMTDAGRDVVGTLNVTYNSFNDRARVLEAKTINGDRATPVEPNQIVEKELRDSQVVGFDSSKSTILTYANVRVGSQVFLDYEIESKEPEIPDTWSRYLEFNKAFIDRLEIDVISEQPVFHWINDPDHGLTIEEVQKEHHLRVKSLKAINTVLLNEERNVLHLSRMPILIFSTQKDWAEFGRSMASQYEALLAEANPPALQEIIAKVRGTKHAIEQIDRLTSALGQTIRYFGDWKRRRGGYIPRPIGEVMNTQYADCKEISLVLIAALRQLGYQANVALVRRGYLPDFFDRPYAIPSAMLFNHAIVRAQKDGEVYWIDGTNRISFASGIPIDVEDRPAFVLYGSFGKLERTKRIKPSHNRYVRSQIIKLKSNEEIEVEGRAQAFGEAAFRLLSLCANLTREECDWNFVKAEAMTGDVIQYQIEDYPQKIRSVSNQERRYSARLRSFLFTTNQGLALPLLPFLAIDRIIHRLPSESGDTYLEGLGTRQSEIRLEGVAARNPETLNCEIQSPWIRSRRTIENQQGAVVTTDTVKILKDVVLGPETSNPVFQKLQADLNQCYSRRMILIEAL